MSNNLSLSNNDISAQLKSSNDELNLSGSQTSNLSDDEIEKKLDSYLLNLKILSNIKEFDKLSTDGDNIIIDTPHIFQGLIRAWNGDSRTITITNINSLINYIFEISDILLEKELVNTNNNSKFIIAKPKFMDNNSMLFQKIVIGLNESINGLQNLKITYIGDVSITSKLDLIITKIQNRINKINAMLKIDTSYVSNK